MAAIDLPFNNSDLYYISARRLPRSAVMPGPASGPPGPTTSSSSATASHPELSTTTPRKNGSNTGGLSNGLPSTSSSSLAANADANTIYPSSTSATALASLGANASPTDVLLTLPPPILRLLVVSSPFISFLTTISQLLTWTHPNRFAPFFLPVLWTVACMGGEYLLRFGLNGLLLGILAIGWIVRKGAERRRLKGEPVTVANRGVAATVNKDSIAGTSGSSSTVIRENSNVRTLTLGTSAQPAIQVLTPSALNLLLAEATILAKHVQILHHTFSPLLTPFSWKDTDLSWNTTYLLLNSYPYYLLMTYFVPLRLLLLVLGLLALFWEAPWFAVVRKSLWASALVRRSCRVGLTLLRGELSILKSGANKGPEGVGVLTRWQTFKQIWRDAKTEDALIKSRAKSMSSSNAAAADLKRGRSRSIAGAKSVSKYEENIVEIQYLFSIFENQRWWIGLEWTQALLPNERPSWSDPTHAPCSPPGSFQLPPPSIVYISATQKRVFTWKWSDPEWRIRGTAGVLISPSTIGANPNPVNTSNSSGGVASGTAAATAASMSDKAAKDLKDVMGSLGDWKSMLASRRDTDDKDRRNSSSTVATDEKGPVSSAANAGGHVRKGSASLFDGFNALVGAKDGKPVLKDGPGSPSQESKGRLSASIDGGAAGDTTSSELAPTEDKELPGHPTRIDGESSVVTSDPELKNWEVDAQGWVYTDNQWEKPTSKGGMGRYTRRRAWVRRAVVVEKVEEVDLNDENEREKAVQAAARLGLKTQISDKQRSQSRESKKEK